MNNATIAKLNCFSDNTNSVVAFETLSGELQVHQRGESLVMDFPLNKPEIQVKTHINMATVTKFIALFQQLYLFQKKKKHNTAHHHQEKRSCELITMNLHI